MARSKWINQELAPTRLWQLANRWNQPPGASETVEVFPRLPVPIDATVRELGGANSSPPSGSAVAMSEKNTLRRRGCID
ncbi:hypothetical protein ZHAS_00009688 [Anopheles sinensis]|uniref:Uncharacterized protein n=1 Tax=Anopheles sinensis TaxID=74873 RepID=A0A084VV52_ANOSI|nr:hypothetical protein ZHAS_00009688 [Anopheles sinensis]